jgi:hypothetical protein
MVNFKAKLIGTIVAIFWGAACAIAFWEIIKVIFWPTFN